jgi:hypothetical protein
MICGQYHQKTHAMEAGTPNLDNIDDQIELFTVSANLPTGSMVWVAADAMAMNPEKSILPASHSEHLFVIYMQPLDRKFSCWPLQVMPHASGRATEKFHTAIDVASQMLSAHGLTVKYLCTNGDTGNRQSHQTFLILQAF